MRYLPSFSLLPTDVYRRTLVAAIRDKGLCPCPRCLVKFDEIPNLGTPVDNKIRSERVRRDDDARQQAVEAARKLIYEDGYVVNSERVEELLKETSLIPTVVRARHQYHFVYSLTRDPRTPSGRACVTRPLTSIVFWWLTCCTSLNWVFGRPSCYTSFAS